MLRRLSWEARQAQAEAGGGGGRGGGGGGGGGGSVGADELLLQHCRADFVRARR